MKLKILPLDQNSRNLLKQKKTEIDNYTRQLFSRIGGGFLSRKKTHLVHFSIVKVKT